MFGVNLGKRENNHNAAVMMRERSELAGKPTYIGLCRSTGQVLPMHLMEWSHSGPTPTGSAGER